MCVVCWCVGLWVCWCVGVCVHVYPIIQVITKIQLVIFLMYSYASLSAND